MTRIDLSYLARRGVDSSRIRNGVWIKTRLLVFRGVLEYHNVLIAVYYRRGGRPWYFSMETV